MSKRDQSILIFAATVLILFAINYFVTYPMVQSYYENIEQVAVLDDEIAKLELNIQQGEEIEAAITEVETNIISAGLEQYYYENYSVHNFFVDKAQNFGIEVNSLSLSNPSVVSLQNEGGDNSAIEAHPLISGQMTSEEIQAVPSFYEIVMQTTSLSVTGTINDILDYIDHIAIDEVYVVIPSLTLSDFIDNNEDVSISIQFNQYYYQEADIQQNTEVTVY